MKDPILKLQILARAEMALAQIRAQRAGSRSALFGIAMVFALLGLGALNLAIYQALVPTQGPALAALILALLNALAAIVVMLFARKAGPGANEEKLAREMREMAYAELGADMEQVKNELAQITYDVRNIRSSFTSFTSSATSTLGPIMGLLLKAVKRD